MGLKIGEFMLINKKIFFLLFIPKLFCYDSILLDNLKKMQQKIDKQDFQRFLPNSKVARSVIKIYDEIQQPVYKKFFVNTEDKNHDTCVISYSSFNDKYPTLQSAQLDALKKNGYQGHYLIRTGGWPGMECECLKHAVVPYGFKACFFIEAYKLGYKTVIWLDTPVKPLNTSN